MTISIIHSWNVEEIYCLLTGRDHVYGVRDIATRPCSSAIDLIGGAFSLVDMSAQNWTTESCPKSDHHRDRGVWGARRGSQAEEAGGRGQLRSTERYSSRNRRAPRRDRHTYPSHARLGRDSERGASASSTHRRRLWEHPLVDRV
jgi:hypothetical protein